MSCLASYDKNRLIEGLASSVKPRVVKNVGNAGSVSWLTLEHAGDEVFELITVVCLVSL